MTAALKQKKMYGKIGKRQDQDKLPPEDRGQQEADFGGIGNEVLNHYLENDLNLLNAGSNEANNGNEGGTALTLINEIVNEEPEVLPGIAENEANNGAVPADTAAEGLAHYYMGDLNRLVPDSEKAEKKHKDSGNIMNDDLISEKGGEKEPDLLSVRSRRSSLSMKNEIRDDQSEISDLGEAEEDMDPVDGWGFAAEKMPERTKPSFWKKLGSAAAYYGGKTIGKIGGDPRHPFQFTDLRKIHRDRLLDRLMERHLREKTGLPAGEEPESHSRLGRGAVWKKVKI